jgi:hypothetical protein
MTRDANDILLERGTDGLRQEWDSAFINAPRGTRADNSPREIGNAAKLREKRFAPIKYIVPGYLAEGCTILAGRPKLGKSWLMMDVGLAVAGGRFCLGQIRCDQGDVLYLALEDNERRLQSRIAKILGCFASDWPEAFQYSTEWPRADDGGLDRIQEWIEAASKPLLVIVDVLARFRPQQSSLNQLYESDYHAISGLQDIAIGSGVAIVVVHHLRKDNGAFDPFEKVSGSLGHSAAADTVLVLDKDSGGTTLYGRGRDVEEIESAIEFNPSSCRWTILGSASEVRRSSERQAILGVFDGPDDELSPTEIANAAGMPYANVRQLLVKMAKDGELTKAKRGRYRLPDPDHKITSDHSAL